MPSKVDALGLRDLDACVNASFKELSFLLESKAFHGRPVAHDLFPSHHSEEWLRVLTNTS